MVHNPVRLPGRASIKGEGLLPASRVCRYVVPRKTNVDWLAVDWGVNALIKQSHALLKVSHQRPEIWGIASIEPDDRPLLCRLIKRADRQSEHALPVGKGRLILLDTSPTVKLFGASGNRREFFPCPLARWRKWVGPPPVVNSPGAQEKIEISDFRHAYVFPPKNDTVAPVYLLMRSGLVLISGDLV